MDQETESTTVTKSARRGKVVAENSDGTTTTPPTKPSDSTAEGEMPEMPAETCDEPDEACEMLEPPEGFDGEMPGEMQGGPGGGGMYYHSTLGFVETWHPAAYLAMGAGGVLLSIVIIYACFSKCFHEKPAQTFDTAAKFIWAVVAMLVLATGLAVLCYFIPTWVG